MDGTMAGVTSPVGVWARRMHDQEIRWQDWFERSQTETRTIKDFNHPCGTLKVSKKGIGF